MQFDLLSKTEGVIVPVSALKGVMGNPKAKQFYWTGEYFGVAGKSMGETCVLWFSKSQKTGRWWCNTKIEPQQNYQTYKFSDTTLVPNTLED